MKKGDEMSILKISICAVGLMVMNIAKADDVKMFSSRTPSAEEMGSILFADQPKVMKTRSLSFGKAKSTPKSISNSTDNSQPRSAIGLPIKFAHNSAEVLEESKPYLNEIGKMLKLSDYSNENLVIEGHTDAGGTEEYNKYLSEERALAVKNYLSDYFLIDSNRLKVIGMGEELALKSSNPHAASNRKVLFRKAP